MGIEGETVHRASDGVIEFPPFRLNPAEHRLWRGDRQVPLKPKAFAVLKYLVDRPGKLVTHEELLGRFWGDVHTGEAVLKSQIREIRQALGDRARQPRFIETAHRRGYRFIGKVVTSPVSPISPANELTPRAPPGAEHFVSREAELQFLLQRAWRAGAGERQIIFVMGEAGVGKTALVNALLRRLMAESKALVTWGQCVEQYGAGEPYLPIIEALRRACADQTRPYVADCLGQHGPPWIARNMSSASWGPLGAADSAAFPVLPERALRQITEALEALAAETPVALLIEDLHWADPSTIDLLAYLAQRADPARLLVLATYRPLEARLGRLQGVVQTLEVRGRCICLSVPHLSEQAVRDYLDRRFADHQLPAAVAKLLHRRTEGNALFMIGVVDGWLDRGMLKAGNGHCELNAGLGELALCVPSSFVRMIEGDLDRLSSFERRVLEAASVAGSEFSTAAVAAALGEDAMLVEEMCMRWARRGQFLRNNGKAEWKDGTLGERCEFIHALYQQITYDQIGAARRASLHLRMGERLETGHSREAHAIAPELALHFQKGRDYLRAVRYLRIAAEQALHHGAYHEAIDHLTLAIQLVDSLPEHLDKLGIELELRVLIAPPLRSTKGYGAAEVEYAYARAAELCEQRHSMADLFVVLAGMSALYILRGESTAGLQIGERFLRLAEIEGDASAIAEAHAVIGGAHHHLGRHRAASAHLEHVMAFYEASEREGHRNVTSLDQGFSARCFQAYSLCMQGYVDHARDQMQTTLMAARASGSPLAVAFALGFTANIHLLRREPDLADSVTDAHATLCREQGFEMFSSMAVLAQGAAQVQREAWDSATELLRRGWQALRATGARVYAKNWLGLGALAHGRRGDLQRALEILAEAEAQPYPDGEQLWDAELFRIKGELLLAAEAGGSERRTGARALASRSEGSGESCLLRALEIARQQDATLFELRAAMSLCGHWVRHGRRTQACELLTEVYARFTEGLDTADLREARLLMSSLCAPPA